jgi:hypothetical protein
MKIDDVSPTVFSERFRHYLDQFKAPGQQPDDDVIDLASEAATQEMLDEQQTMLFAICKKLGLFDIKSENGS